MDSWEPLIVVRSKLSSFEHRYLGALCVYDGINDTAWNQYGFIKKVAEISGKEFNTFANWSTYDNNTAVYYETWTVYNTDNQTDPGLTMYFDSFDCASWVLRFG